MHKVLNSQSMKVIDEIPVQLWDSVAGQCGYATFFHTHTWAKIFADTFPGEYRIAAKGFEFGDGDIVLFPIMETGHTARGYLKFCESNVPGTYGGPISFRPITREKMELISEYLCGAISGRLRVFGNPYVQGDDYFAGGAVLDNSTHIFSLNKFATEGELLASYDGKVRCKINKAEREGMEVSAARSIEEVRAYYDIYQESLKRWGTAATSQYPLRLFENAYYTGSENVLFHILRRQGEIIGGSLNFKHGTRCFGWHMASKDEFKSMGAHNFFVHKIFLEAMQKGAELFDCNPSGGHEGTEKFKEHLGAVKTYFRSYQWESSFYKTYKLAKKIHDYRH